jgi:hypothetical protein
LWVVVATTTHNGHIRPSLLLGQARVGTFVGHNWGLLHGHGQPN